MIPLRKNSGTNCTRVIKKILSFNPKEVYSRTFLLWQHTITSYKTRYI